MHVASLVIALYAFAANVSAQKHPDYYTVIKNLQNGLNVTLNGTRRSVEFGAGSPCRYWKSYDAGNTKNWRYYGIAGSGYYVYLRYLKYLSGAIAQADTTAPSLFRLENDEHASYIISLETDATGQKLAWTAETNATDPRGNMIVKLRPYDRSDNQKFALTEEYINPDDC
ncbi:hypothetical protein MGYG_07385 [Nannizzia gypsea CBS 118893]|uniref:Ricin B lectin domain-containing protein n=1 Tax=Arthroderma gypseum (strain ATCC MYA-4604 / CBS 118893) TaxID=535722 RepID=E4V303_ARTGP|nr:hypothetical protein MGYG_07385 [Nannizzia gypsea CBS 118893]EFR04377.1 hypothetical protein MGYG_07385 [Nannizzia gypsea CBS 118893]